MSTDLTIDDVAHKLREHFIAAADVTKMVLRDAVSQITGGR